MENLEKAKELLGAGGNTCVLASADKTYVSVKRGVAPLIGWIDDGVNLRGFSAADKVVGKAAALLYAYMGVKEIYADVVSAPAAEALARHGVRLCYSILVDRIVNRAGDGLCPMESAVICEDDPAVALAKIREKLADLRKDG